MNWEDNIKETLEKRTLQPSTAAWEALEERLQAAENKNNRPWLWWIGGAAAVVTIFLAVTIFFNGNVLEKQPSKIVDTQKQIEERTYPEEQLSRQTQEVKLASNKSSVATADSHNRNETSRKKTKSQAAMPESTVAVAGIENTVTSPIQNETHAKHVKEQLENQKVLEVVAEINTLKQTTQSVTDADIEALLVQAQNELMFQTALEDNNRLTVDANALLLDVEMEVQQSFRNKIFEALKHSYETVRTAVAERRN